MAGTYRRPNGMEYIHFYCTPYTNNTRINFELDANDYMNAQEKIWKHTYGPCSTSNIPTAIACQDESLL